MRACDVCQRPYLPHPGSNGNSRYCSERCRYLRRDEARRAKSRQHPGARHSPAGQRADALARDLGPEHPLLLPPEVARREREALERRIREAYEDGVTAEGLLERFGPMASHVLSRACPGRGRDGKGMTWPLGAPA